MENDFGINVYDDEPEYVATTVKLTDQQRGELILKEIAASTLNSELTERGFYSVCSIDNLAGMTGVTDYRTREYYTLKAMHCVYYDKMTPAVKRNLAELIQIVVKPMVGTLEFSDKTHHGVRLFKPDYLPESYTPVEQPAVVAPETRFDRLRNLLGLRKIYGSR